MDAAPFVVRFFSGKKKVRVNEKMRFVLTNWVFVGVTLFEDEGVLFCFVFLLRPPYCFHPSLSKGEPFFGQQIQASKDGSVSFLLDDQRPRYEDHHDQLEGQGDVKKKVDA